jgi:hypothetical protein
MAAEKFIIEIRTKGFKTANQSLEQVTKSTRAFSREANKGSGVAATFRRNMSGLRNNLLLVSFAFGSIVVGVKKFIDAASGFENVKTRLVGLMGSTERAERAFRNFNDVAATTPFSLQDVVEAGAQLKAFGADAEGMIKPVADLAAFMGTTATEAANSLGRAFAGGAGAADILRERGILNLIQSFKGIDDLSKITLPEFRQALQETLIDPSAGIAGSTDRMAQTFTGAFSNMTDSVTRLAANIGNTFMPILKDMIIGLGETAKAADNFLTGIKEGLPDFDIFGSSVEKFTARIERLTLEQLNAELEKLQSKFKDVKEPIDNTTESTATFVNGLAILGKISEDNSANVKTLQDNFGDFDGSIVKVSDDISIKLTPAFEGINTVQKEFNEVQGATTVGIVALSAKIDVINQEIKKRTDNTEELKTAQKTFNDLLKETDLAQLKEIETLELLIAKHQEELGTNEQVMAVLTMLKEKYDDLTGATKKAKEESEANAKAKKQEEEQLLKTAAATTAIASGLQQIFQKGASAEQQFKAILSTFAQLVSMGVFGGSRGAASLGGSILQAFTGFIGHTGGLIGNNGIQRFATGGMVQGQDNVPILAQSGEFIMQRSAVNSIGLQNLAEMNNTGQGGGVTINIAGDMVGDEDHVRTKVLPAIREELRREANA